MPTLSASYNVDSAGVDTSTLTSPSFTPNVGDVIVVKVAIWENPSDVATLTDTQGNTYTRRAYNPTAGYKTCSIWTTIAGSATSMTVSATVSDACDHSITVERWTVAALDTTPASGMSTGTGSPAATITTTQPYSVVTWVNNDGWSGIGHDPAGHTYNTTSATPTEDGIHDSSSYTAYFAYQQATSAGSQTVGMTAPTGQVWNLVAIEILDIAASVDPDQTSFGTLAWQ